MTTIVSGFSESYRPLAELVSKNHQWKADTLGIPYHLEEFPEGQAAWPKLTAGSVARWV